MFLRRFTSADTGSIVPIFALGLLAIAGTTGAALDYGAAARIRSNLQEATDAAALAAIRRPTGERANLTAQFMAVNFTASTHAGAFRPDVRLPENVEARVTVRASGAVPTALLGVVGMSAIQVTAESTAVIDQAGAPCFVVLDPSADGALRVNGNARVDARDCEIHDHSAHSAAFIFNSGAVFDATRFCVRGGAINRGTTSGRVETGCTPAPDPHASRVPALPAAGCTFTNQVFNPAVTVQIDPGVYRGNTIFNGSPRIVMRPGLYVLRGPFIVNSGAELQGANVSIALASNDADLVMNGQITLDIMAPNAGPYADWLIWQAAPQPRRNFIFNTEVAQSLQGIVYLPGRDVIFNSTTRTGRRDRLSVVANTLIVNAQAGWRFEPLSRTSGAVAATPRLVR